VCVCVYEYDVSAWIMRSRTGLKIPYENL